jgi:Zn-dependent M28 family amino/carboxypeptidase
MVMVSAHLDHIGIMPSGGEDRIANGALDNAAGIATMLEAARAFEGGKKPRRTIAFVALTGEEKGLFGSEYLAKYPLPGRKLVANVNLDMPILLYDFTDVIAFGAEHSNIGEAVTRAAGQMGVRLSPDPEPEQNSFVRSDHYSFVKQGVPAVSLETGWANGGQAAAKAFLDSHYHAVSDDLSQPINWSSAAKFAKLNYLIASDLADGRDAPRWYAGDFFGDKFAAGQPRAAKANAAP